MTITADLLQYQATQIIGIAVLFVILYTVLYRPVLGLMARSDRVREQTAARTWGSGGGESGEDNDRSAHKGPDQTEDAPRPPLLKNWGLVLTVASVLVADQVSKYFVRQYIPLHQSWPEEGLLRFTHGVNSGAIFGLFPNQTYVLVLASVLAIGFLVYFYRTHVMPVWPLRIAIGLQLGGAVGNLIDRVRAGGVVDFIDFGGWPVFNVADSAIVVGIVVLIGVTLLVKEEGDGRTEGEDADGRVSAETGGAVSDESRPGD